MTEAEWLARPGPVRHIHHLVVEGLASDRKLWLLSVAHCRCIWHLLDAWERGTIELAERCADGKPGRRELESRFKMVYSRRRPRNRYWHYVRPCVLKAAATERLARKYGGETWVRSVDADDEVGVKGRASMVNAVNSFIIEAEALARADPDGTYSPWGSAAQAMAARVEGAFRDIFGNPFRRVSIDPSWVSGPVRRLARAIYRDHAFDRMPELADALQASGCTSTDLIDHCRRDGEHFRGCWSLDLLLGKS